MDTVANDRVGSSAESGLPPAPALGMRVREVLGASTLAGARVLAGASGLDRIVRRLNVMEVPDILPWVKPHELLLTTGYPLRHNPEALAGLVAELDRRELAAIAIKLHRYLDELPAQMLAEADRLGFPIIEFPGGVGFDDVLNQVLGELLNRQAAALQRSEDVHRALVAVVLEGGDLDDLATELARILGSTVMISTADRGGTVRAGGAAEPGSTRTVVPIVAGRVRHGQIVALSPVPLTDADVHVLERAATVAALAVTKRLAVAAVESKYRADFLRDVLTGRVPDVPAAVRYARTLGWEIDRPLVAVVAELDPGRPQPEPGPDAEPGQARERFLAAWQGVVAARDPQAPVAGFTDEVVALLACPPGGNLERLATELHRRVRADGRLGRVSFSVGVSRVAAAPQDLPGAYEQARKAVRIGRRLSGNGARATFDRLGVHRLLSLVPDQAELRGFADEMLGELAIDTPEARDLRHTLDVLLDTNGNVAQAARALHFHYNTLRYRIYKLEKTLGPFMTSAPRRLDLALALRILELRGL